MYFTVAVVSSLLYWCDLYDRFKQEALCLDIEVTAKQGSISLVGIFKPREGPVEHLFFVRGKDLTTENLKQAFKQCKLLITFNGLAMDVPAIKANFPGALPDNLPVLDLYLFAKRLGFDTNLKSLEFNLKIKRLYEFTENRHIAVRLWNKYERYHDETALQDFIEYNKQDTVNLYLIAEKLVALAREKEKMNP